MKRTIFLTVMFLAVICSVQIFAEGTPAGTVITNQAVGNYKDANGNDMAQVTSNEVTTTVSQVAGVDIAPDGSQNIQRNHYVDYALTVTNTGNGTDTFDLSASTSSSGSSTFSEEIYYDANGNGVIDAGETTVSATSALAADATYDIVVRVSVTGGVKDEVGTTTVTATSQYNGSVTDQATLTSTVIAADIAGTLAADNYSKAPEEIITYTLTYNNNAGTDVAYNTRVTPVVPTNTEWVGNVTLNGSPTGTGEGVEVVVGDLAVSGSATLTYQVRVSAGTPAGTNINNTLTIKYDDSQSTAYPDVDVSTPSAVVVSQDYGFTTSVADPDLSGDPGDDVQYSIQLTNNGNGTDNYNISESSGQGWTWTYYLDANNDGVADGGAITNTGDVTSGSTTYILAVVTIPGGTADGTSDVTDVTFTAQVDPANQTSTEQLTTTVTAPDLGLVKSVNPTGNQPPGTTLTYSVVVTNNGTGDATEVVITDNIPTNTTYVSSSLQIDGASKTDATGDDNASCDGSTATFSLGTMASGASITCSFQVTID